MGKYLKLYEKFEKAGRVFSVHHEDAIGNGLCDHLGVDHPKFRLFHPTDEDRQRLLYKKGHGSTWWASDLHWSASFSAQGSNWSNTRKNIILFLAAMNNEL